MWWNTPFQSTLPQGEWLLAIIFCFNSFAFQSTLPQGEWRRLSENSECYFLFQSTLPQGEWQDQIYIKYNLPWFQSTLPQGEWLKEHCSYTGNMLISIHTPTRGVTYLDGVATGIGIFQSTLPQGEWRYNKRFQKSSWNFNPHSHKGSDLICSFLWMYILHFNPHSHKGSDRSRSTT